MDGHTRGNMIFTLTVNRSLSTGLNPRWSTFIRLIEMHAAPFVIR